MDASLRWHEENRFGRLGAVMTRRLRVHVSALTSQDPTFWVTEERIAAACRRHREVARRVSFDWSWDHDRFAEGIAEADAMVGWRFPKETLHDMAPRLKLIQLTGAGTEHLQPFDWLWRGLRLANNSGAHGPKAAEFAGAAVLALCHGLPFFATKQRQKVWEKRFTANAEGRTAVVVGLGGMGGHAARWLKQRIGMTVIGVSRSGKGPRGLDEVVSVGRLDRVLPKADVVVIMAPLTAETRGLFDRRCLESMKPGAALVNMGRARIVDHEALIDLLTSGHLSGAVLDVFDPEPLPKNSPLWTTPNLLVVPHCSSDDAEQYIPRTLDILFDNLGRLLDGRPNRNRIDTRLQY